MNRISVQPAVDADIETALHILVRHAPAEERDHQVAEALAASRRGDLPLEGLLLARRDNQPVGAMLTIIQPGGTAALWPPETIDGVENVVADALAQAAVELLDAQGISIAQSILEPGDTSGGQVLTRNGIPYLTDLVFMERRLAAPIPAAKAPGEFVTYCAETHEQFARLLEETYRGTYDCPELDGLRGADEALSGHKASGEFRPKFWRLYFIDSLPAGLLLISEHPTRRAWELVYLGVAPHARGMGLGRRMLIHTLKELAQTDADTFFLAVDCRNRYAIEVYRNLGFVDVAQRALHVRTHGNTNPPGS